MALLTGWRERPTPHPLGVPTFPVCRMVLPPATTNPGVLEGGSSVLGHPAPYRERIVKETRVQIPALPRLRLPPPSVPSGGGVALDLEFDRNESQGRLCSLHWGEPEQ